jgi:hypothetical protein
MTPMRLTTWFRRRMAVLVAVSMLLAWAALTVGFHLQERRELIRTCRADAVRVALSIAEEIQRRPMLWRYDGAKMSDRIASQGVRPATAIVVRDVQGASVDIEGFRPASGVAMLWGRAPVLVGNVRMADVWVGASIGAVVAAIGDARGDLRVWWPCCSPRCCMWCPSGPWRAPSGVSSA